MPNSTIARLFTLFIVLISSSALADKRSDIFASMIPLGTPTYSMSINNDSNLIKLGAFLFSSKALSGDKSIACTSCHDAALAYSGAEPVAVGIEGIRGHRHALPLINLYASKNFTWDGRAASLEEQVLIPLEHPDEMAIDWPSAINRLNVEPSVRLYLAATGTASITRKAVFTALAAFVRSLVSGGSAFDRYYYGGDATALTQYEKDGLALFVRKGQCATCHLLTGESAPFTDNSFHSIGIGYTDGAYKDAGRGQITGQATDIGLFKTPTLRNVSRRRYFMHDGSFDSLRDVVDYYNKGGTPGASNIDARLHRLFLSDEEEDKIVAFLATLDSPIKSRRSR